MYGWVVCLGGYRGIISCECTSILHRDIYSHVPHLLTEKTRMEAIKDDNNVGAVLVCPKSGL